MKKTQGYQGQKETIDATLHPIPLAGQYLEERKDLNTSEEQEATGKEKHKRIKIKNKHLMQLYNQS